MKILKILIFLFYLTTLKSEDLWIDRNLYGDQLQQLKVGDYIILDFKEKLVVYQQIDSTKDKKYILKLIPDNLLFDYLPDVGDERSSQTSFRVQNKDKIEFNFKLPLKIVSINGDLLQLEGKKELSYNNVSYFLFIRGETNSGFVKMKNLKSENLGNYALEIQIIEASSNQNLQLEQDKIEINDDTKRKIFIEYLRNILKDQNINVP